MLTTPGKDVMRDQADPARVVSAGHNEVSVPQARTREQQEVDADRRSVPPPRCRVLADRLRAHGLEPPEMDSNASPSARSADAGFCAAAAAGGSIRVAVGPLWQEAVSGTGDGLQELVARAARRLEARLPLSFWFSDFGVVDPTVMLQQFCERLRQSLLPRGPLAGRTATVLHSHAVPQRAHDLIASEVLGAAQRFVYLDNLQMHETSSSAVRQRSVANWKLLRACAATGRPLLPIYGGIVRSTCPLLGDEKAGAVLVPAGLLCPADSAWLPIEVPLEGFLCTNGVLDWGRLIPALDLAVAAGDELIDHVRWIEAALAKDAIVNRRLAVRVTGLGAVVRSRDEDPGDLACLRRLDRDVQRIRQVLNEATRRLARLRGPLPALLHAETVDDWPNGPAREGWQRRWRMALARTAVRNRNVLVLSPYDVLPCSDSADSRFTDLLPVIRHADAWCFAGQPRFAAWSVHEYRHFHRRARATIQGNTGPSLIAAGV